MKRLSRLLLSGLTAGVLGLGVVACEQQPPPNDVGAPRETPSAPRPAEPTQERPMQQQPVAPETQRPASPGGAQEPPATPQGDAPTGTQQPGR